MQYYKQDATNILNYIRTFKPSFNESTDLKYCAFFDLDDTLTCSQTYLPIVPIVNVYNECKKLKIHPFIITARQNLNFVQSILSDANITDYSGLLLFPDSEIYTQENSKIFKTKSRYSIVQQGYIPVFSVGDREVDIGEYGGRGFLLKK